MQTHGEMVRFIWDICNLLRGPYKRNEYRKVILPLTVLRRFDCALASTKQAVLDDARKYVQQSESLQHEKLKEAARQAFYNTARLDFGLLLDDPNLIARNLNAYIAGFSPNVREIMERFEFGAQIARMDEKGLLFQVVQRFAGLDLSPDQIDSADGIRVRGVDPARRGAGERGSRRALHTSRGHPADGQPAADVRRRLGDALADQEGLRPCLRLGRDDRRGRIVPAQAQ